MGKFTEFKVPLKAMSPGVHPFNYHLDKTFFKNMESADVRDANLNVELTVTLKGDLYAFDFKITGTVTLLCDRCLDDLIFPIEAVYRITVKYGDDYNDDSDTLLEIPSSDNDLNVAYMIYDTVMLAIPIKHVHPLGKCNRAMSAILRKHNARGPVDDIEQEMLEGIDDADGEDDTTATSPSAIDPRWDALKGLVSGGDTEN